MHAVSATHAPFTRLKPAAHAHIPAVHTSLLPQVNTLHGSTAEEAVPPDDDDELDDEDEEDDVDNEDELDDDVEDEDEGEDDDAEFDEAGEEDVPAADEDDAPPCSEPLPGAPDDGPPAEVLPSCDSGPPAEDAPITDVADDVGDAMDDATPLLARDVLPEPACWDVEEDTPAVPASWEPSGPSLEGGEPLHATRRANGPRARMT